MLKKRLIGVITIQQGLAVQSFGYKKYLPIGAPEVLVENLDRWGADEILVQCIDRSSRSAGPDLELLQNISREGRATPLIYSGGIRTEQDAVNAIQAGADRICVDALLHDSPEQVARISSRLGAQALIASVPVARAERKLSWLDYRSGASSDLSASLLDILRNKMISETLLIDWQHEGYPAAFDERLLQDFPSTGSPLIVFGGMSEADQMVSVLRMPAVAAVAVGNFLSYTEHAVQKYKACLTGVPMREPHFDKGWTS
ncbi:HisA/HisF-related TIM barrel protein [Litorivivens sp.]|uniref:HisA/HisF-related TIM barrel protein n=1 Tax=Litorivivens sp. TaxID=2020868 RepID=UPI003562AB12